MHAGYNRHALAGAAAPASAHCTVSSLSSVLQGEQNADSKLRRRAEKPDGQQVGGALGGALSGVVH
jgi:hypothetical protein